VEVAKTEALQLKTKVSELKQKAEKAKEAKHALELTHKEQEYKADEQWRVKLQAAEKVQRE
jgi:hypothetical protein